MWFFVPFYSGPYEYVIVVSKSWTQTKGLNRSRKFWMRRSERDATIPLMAAWLERRTRLENNLNTEMQMASFIRGAPDRTTS